MAEANSRYSTAASKSLGKLRFYPTFRMLGAPRARSQQTNKSFYRSAPPRPSTILGPTSAIKFLIRLAAEPVEREFISPERRSSNSLSRSHGLCVDQLLRESFVSHFIQSATFHLARQFLAPQSSLPADFALRKTRASNLPGVMLRWISIF